MKAPLTEVARRRAWEQAIEAVLPLALAGALTYATAQVLARPSESQTVTTLQLAVLLGSVAATFGWAAGRQMWTFGWKRLWLLVGVGAVVGTLAVYGMASAVTASFSSLCLELSGEMVTGGDSLSGKQVSCRLAGVTGNPFLTGTSIRPRWGGVIPLWGWVWSVGLALLGVVAARDLRLFRSRVPFKFYDSFRWQPGGGSASALGEEKIVDGAVVACANNTWWGEPCGQLYSADKIWAPGAWCGRCQLPVQLDSERYTIDVAIPAMSDITRLNALERLDAVAWEPGTPLMRPDASVSGHIRWFRVGRVTFPGVLTVSQALALIYEALPGWGATAELPVQRAAQEAVARGSRLAAWFWAGDVDDRLHLPTPSRSVVLAAGARRLRDFIPGLGQRLTLQLDTGVCPIELRSGFVHRVRRQGAGEGAGKVLHRNFRVFTWIPTAPSDVLQNGLWVPRLEGAALRQWLATQRNRTDLPQGATLPSAYVPFQGKSPKPRVLLVSLNDTAAPAPAIASLLAGWQEASIEVVSVVGASPDAAAAEALMDHREHGADLVIVDASGSEPGPVPALLACLRLTLRAPRLVVLGQGPPHATEDEDIRLRLPLEPEDEAYLLRLAHDASQQLRHVGSSLSALPNAGLLGLHRGAFDYRRYPLLSEVERRGRVQIERLATTDVTRNDDPLLNEADSTEGGESALYVGRSVREWDWFELGQLAQLRREVLVMRPVRGA